jgi:hypothetical protein
MRENAWGISGCIAFLLPRADVGLARQMGEYAQCWAKGKE